MGARSLNKVQLIGNLTRDPELRYTPQGTAVCSFGLATNRSWVTDTGEKREAAEFHRIVAWSKLAELCSQLLFKGRKVFVEGRLQTRQWTAQDGAPRQTTEIIISDMIILDSRRAPGEEEALEVIREKPLAEAGVAVSPEKKEGKPGGKAVAKPSAKKTSRSKSGGQAKKAAASTEPEEEQEAQVEAEDIPF